VGPNVECGGEETNGYAKKERKKRRSDRTRDWESSTMDGNVAKLFENGSSKRESRRRKKGIRNVRGGVGGDLFESKAWPEVVPEKK